MDETTKELLDACKQAAEQIRRCDYTPARSTLLTAIKKAEAAMSEGKPKVYGWIKWAGGECPVSKGTLVDVKYRDGERLLLLPANELADGWRDASSCFWRYDNAPNDIVAYRISK